MSDEFKSPREKYLYIRKLEAEEKITKEIIDACDVELRRLKRNTYVSCTSRYRKNYVTSLDFFPTRCGFNRVVDNSPFDPGEVEEWNKAFEYFQNQKVNKTYGKKVDRSKVFNENGFKHFKYGEYEK
jgi:hypothetical protein